MYVCMCVCVSSVVTDSVEQDSQGEAAVGEMSDNVLLWKL